MKRILSFIAILSLANVLFAQDSKQLKEAFLDGEYFLSYESYIDALSFYQKIYDQNPENANINYKIGLCYLNIPGKKDLAIPYFEKAVLNITSDYKEGNYKEQKAPEDAMFFLGNAYQIQNRFSDAIVTFKKYLSSLEADDSTNINFVNQEITSCNTALKMISNPVYFDSQNPGPPLNTSGNDFDAVLSADQQSLIYISSLKFYDALFYTTKSGNSWSIPVNITPDIKSDGDYYPTGLSADGTQLLLTRNDKFNSDLYLSKLVDGKWTPAIKLDKHINTKFWESHGSFSPDGKTIYFTSNRTGGFGGLDIYKTTFDEQTAVWGTAINLGPVINTQFNEETPFICEDNKTLYFASQGHSTMGGFDIFYSTLKEDGSWSDPANIGYPLNSADDDLFYQPFDNGIRGLASFSGMKDNIGSKDIYFVEIYSNRNPRPVEITGQVTLNGAPLKPGEQVEILVTSPSGKTQNITASGPDGKFSLVEKETGSYKISLQSEGYHGSEQTVTLPFDYSAKTVGITADLQQIAVPVAEPVVLHNIYFNFNSSYIKGSEKSKVKELAEIMKNNPDLIIEVEGFTDITGPRDYNMWLARRRAEMVGKTLVKQGIDKSRIRTKGIGPEAFIAINRKPDNTDAPEGRRFNRRAEIHVVSTSNKAIVSEQPKIPESLRYRK